MEKKFSLTLDKEFIEYCELNKIDDIDKFAKKVFKKGFDLEKYGNGPKKGIKEGTTKSNVKNTEGKSRQAPPPPPPKPKKTENESLYDE